MEPWRCPPVLKLRLSSRARLNVLLPTHLHSMNSNFHPSCSFTLINQVSSLDHIPALKYMLSILTKVMLYCIEELQIQTGKYSQRGEKRKDLKSITSLRLFRLYFHQNSWNLSWETTEKVQEFTRGLLMLPNGCASLTWIYKGFDRFINLNGFGNGAFLYKEISIIWTPSFISALFKDFWVSLPSWCRLASHTRIRRSLAHLLIRSSWGRLATLQFPGLQKLLHPHLVIQLRIMGSLLDESLICHSNSFQVWSWLSAQFRLLIFHCKVNRSTVLLANRYHSAPIYPTWG